METATTINLILVVVGFGMILAEILIGIDSLFDLVLSGLSLLIGGAIGLLFSSSLIGLAVSAVLVVLYWVLGRRYVRQRLHIPGHKTNVEKIVNQTGKVLRVKSNGDYVVSIDGEEWTAESKDELEEGNQIRVIEVNGTVLSVRIY